MQSLVYDAKITEWFSKNASAPEKGQVFNRRSIYEIFYVLALKKKLVITEQKFASLNNFNVVVSFSLAQLIISDPMFFF